MTNVLSTERKAQNGVDFVLVVEMPRLYEVILNNFSFRAFYSLSLLLEMIVENNVWLFETVTYVN